NSSDNTSSTVSGETIVPGENPFQKIKVKAIYLTGVSAGSEKTLNHVIELVNTTELNAVVIDIKEGGVVNYPSNVPEVQKYGLYVKYFNPEAVLKKLHDNNIFVIGRLVCFRDNGLAKAMPELGVKRTDGTLWKEGGSSGGFWTNPYKEDVWKYNTAIAKEAVQLGFDEIQFDYVRFPTVKKSEVNYGSNVTTKVDAISGFLKYAAEQLHTVNGGVPVSADVFGIICESPSDGAALGQDLKRVGLDIDYICPMVYPSHYANASKGPMGNGTGQTINGMSFTAPDLKPYEVVYNTLVKGKETIDAIPGYRAKVRPYLQDFTATYLLKGYYQVYGAEQVRQQIKAVYDAGYEEWILWNGRNIYSEDAFLKE
ncbi:MAG: putative glycoside hydrolase, partial [Clostridiales bacterium]|nr:putative glycoside hydrolase [Clostridiales bacterium]